MAAKKGRRDKHAAQEARRAAQMKRLAESTSASGETGAQRRQAERDEAARIAAAGPSAARWLVPAPIDVVADLLALDPRTRLRGRGDEELRALAGHAEHLVTLGATVPSGRTLGEVVVPDDEARAALEPALDLDTLLSGGPVSDGTQDRVIRLAEELLARAEEHRRGEVDLHALVAPVGAPRHPRADGIETTVRVALDGVAVPAGPDPAVVVTTAGWLAVAPTELFLAAARGMLVGDERDVAGAALHTWLTEVAADPGEPWFMALSTIVDVDVPPLLQQAAARAGSDHADVAGSVLVELIGLRHPLA